MKFTTKLCTHLNQLDLKISRPHLFFGHALNRKGCGIPYFLTVLRDEVLKCCIIVGRVEARTCVKYQIKIFQPPRPEPIKERSEHCQLLYHHLNQHAWEIASYVI